MLGVQNVHARIPARYSAVRQWKCAEQEKAAAAASSLVVGGTLSGRSPQTTTDVVAYTWLVEVRFAAEQTAACHEGNVFVRVGNPSS